MKLFQKPVDSIKAAIQSEKVKKNFDQISRDYDSLNDVTSVGMHRLWKHQVVEDVKKGQFWKILDLCCGTGDMALALAKQNDKAAVVGVDFSDEMLKKARYRKMKENVANVDFQNQNAARLDFPDGSFDCVVLSFAIWNVVERDRVLREALRVLRPGGTFYLLDSVKLDNIAAQNATSFYKKAMVPAVKGFFAGNYMDHVKIAAATTDHALTKKELGTLLKKTGFGQVGCVSFTGGLAVCFRCKKPE